MCCRSAVLAGVNARDACDDCARARESDASDALCRIKAPSIGVTKLGALGSLDGHSICVSRGDCSASRYRLPAFGSDMFARVRCGSARALCWREGRYAVRKLTVREAAALLNASEKSVYRWIAQGVLPAYRINDQYRINRAELLEWATDRKIHLSPEIFAEPEGEAVQPPLEDALRAGGIHYRVGGYDKASVPAIVDKLALPDDVDRDFLYRFYRAQGSDRQRSVTASRSRMCENPIVLQLSQPTVTLCFLERPVDFGSMDGLPVSRLFTLISPTVRGHLHLCHALRSRSAIRASVAIRTQVSLKKSMTLTWPRSLRRWRTPAGSHQD